MPRLLTDEQVEQLASKHASLVVGDLYIARPVPMSNDETLGLMREAIEHDLIKCLEGLMEPEEVAGS
jgi:hypothetical protein